MKFRSISILNGFRQSFYPAALRIRPGSLKDLALEEFRNAVQQIQDLSARSEVSGTRESDQMIRTLGDVGTGLWRLKQRMLQPGTNRPREEMRLAYRHLESTWDALVSGGIELVDHTDVPFKVGMQVKVLAFEPRDGFTIDRIVETIKPSVYYKNEIIQIGEVIVASPPRATA